MERVSIEMGGRHRTGHDDEPLELLLVNLRASEGHKSDEICQYRHFGHEF